MKEKPILFSGPMVRAILDGSKTMTRRVAKLPHPTNAVVVDKGGTVFGPGPYIKAFRRADMNDDGGDPAMHPRVYCPYGYPGDRLWVRETWAHNDAWYDGGLAWKNCRRGNECTWVDYAATFEEKGEPRNFRWRPSIHMPRWASRIMLEVTAVSVERVQDISETDAKAEGVESVMVDGREYGLQTGNDYKWAFNQLWDSINAERGYGWAVNPWVWVVEFKRVTP